MSMNPNRTHEDDEMEPDYAADRLTDTAASSSHAEEIEDMMKRRLKAMEEEAGAQREMQTEVEKEMGSSASSDFANAAAGATQAEKEEFDSRSIFVCNVDYACSREEVQQHFQSCGTINRVTILTDRARQSKGAAYVAFDEVEAVQNALLLNESELHGRQLKVSAKRTTKPGMKQPRVRRPHYKLTPENFEKLFEHVKAIIDSPDTLAGVIFLFFEQALMEPTFCEMYANFFSRLAIVLPDFSEDNEKITFRRLLINQCQEEFERGECEEAEADKTEEEGKVKQTKEESEEKRLKARRRMLGNIQLIGELYKKKMLTERIMHECIKKLLGSSQIPDEKDIEALCKLMSTIGEMIDHPKAKEYMDAYFDIMAKLSENQRYSSRVRFMLKDAIDLRRNKWQQRRRLEGPKKIKEVHCDASQERQAQATRLACGGPVMNNPPIWRGPQMGLASPVSQQPGIHGMGPPQSGRGCIAMQDVWFKDRDRYHFDNRNMSMSLPLPQRVISDESITLGPQGGPSRQMSIRGQPAISSASSAMGDRMVSGPTNGFGYGTSSVYEYVSRGSGTGMRLASPEEWTGPPLGWGQRGLDRNFSAGSRPVPPVGNQQAGLVASSPGSTSHVSLSESDIKDKSISAIMEFYSAKDEE